jgi:pimeloyl-ACP methyl ester carboxylesterase
LSYIKVPVKAATVESNGFSTFYLDAGRPTTSNIPVVLLHGVSASAFCWYDVINEVAQQHRVIVPDVIGHGNSGRPWAIYDQHFYVRWLKEFLDKLDLPQVILVGNSMGGAIATHFTLKYPDQVKRLVLVNATGLGNLISRQGVVYAVGKGWEYGFPAGTFPTRELASRFKQKLRSYMLYYTENVAEERRLLSEYENKVLQTPGTKRALCLSATTVALPIAARRLRTLRQPTLLLWGTADPLVPLAHAEAAHKCLPNSQVLALAEAGHMPFFDQPKHFNHALQAFLNQPA